MFTDYGAATKIEMRAVLPEIKGFRFPGAKVLKTAGPLPETIRPRNRRWSARMEGGSRKKGESQK